MKERENGLLRIGDGSDWHFANGSWKDGENDLLEIAEVVQRGEGDDCLLHHYAFHRHLCYDDVRVRFEFLLPPHSEAGIVLRASDESHFYLLHFPNCGQACRAQHFWAALSKMDDSGYLKHIKLEMVRRVPSNAGLWLSADLALQGSKVTAR